MVVPRRLPWRPALIALALVLSCASGRPDLEPRYGAVHNTLAAMGLVPIGPVHQGVLAQGGEVRVPIDLRAQCVTLVAVGGEGVVDVDLALIAPDGKGPKERDAQAGPQAALRTCLDVAGTYTLVVKMAR